MPASWGFPRACRSKVVGLLTWQLTSPECMFSEKKVEIHDIFMTLSQVSRPSHSVGQGSHINPSMFKGRG